MWLGCSWSSRRLSWNPPDYSFVPPPSFPPSSTIHPFVTCPSVYLSVVKNLHSAFTWPEFASWLPILGEL